jgi:hypothetical protein
MNWAQRIVLGLGAVVMLAAGTSVVYRMSDGCIWGFVGSTPDGAFGIDPTPTVVLVCVIAAATFAAFHATKSRKG